MSLKLWTTDINKLYLWSTEIKKAYLGATLVYDKTTPPNWLLNNLVSYYKADVNWSFPDSHGSNNGTISWATFNASGFINWDYNYDGVNDFVQLNQNLLTSLINADAFTISTWLNIDSIKTSNYILSWWTWGNFLWIAIWFDVLNDRRLRGFIWYQSTAPQCISTNTLEVSWGYYHCVLSYDWTDLRVYLNWVLEAVTSAPSPTWWSANDFRLMRQGSNYTDWKQDETGFWNTRLDDWWVSVWQAAWWRIWALYNSWAWLSYDNFTT